MPTAELRSIGSILSLLRADFPETTISKIRFLEGEGLISPERAPSGYRRYSPADVERLRYILRMQRDYYMPLKVIRERLEMLDRGVEPPQVETPDGPAEIVEPVTRDDAEETQHRAIRLTKRELIQTSGLSEASFLELERQQLVMARRGTLHYGREALMICVCYRKLQGYGMDIRHLRVIKQAAEREAGMVEQQLTPARRGTSAAELLQELTQLVIQTHGALMYLVLRR
ncbi:MAG: MerR family transcriptional regulator [Propionibacteriaceae bacterium]|jgi:DNA-binding transcriptional MerR regulator|nr:MerR family transcriptional regulator [Propionibacteriaceae bacterium]